MRRVIISICVIVVLVGGSASVVSATGCEGYEEAEICINSVDVPTSTIHEGEILDGTVVIENHGNSSGSFSLLVAIDRPEDQTSIYAIEEGTLSPGEIREVPMLLKAEDGQLGERRINVMVKSSNGLHLYDATGYSNTVTILEDQLSLEDISNVLQSVHSLVVLLMILLGYGGYRIGKSRGRKNIR